MVVEVMAHGLVEKFGGDSLRELERNFKGYCAQIKSF